MNRRFRLTQADDFKRVRRLGKSYAHPLMVLIVHPNEEQILRVGFVATRSVGGAVQRNRAKRRLRAAMQPLVPRLTQGWDILLLARQPLPDVSYAQVQSAVEILIGRARLIRNEHAG